LQYSNRRRDYISLTGVPFLRGADFFFVVFLAFFAATVDFLAAGFLAFAVVLAADFFVAFAAFLAFFFLGGTVAYLLPWTFGASTRTLSHGVNWIHRESCRTSKTLGHFSSEEDARPLPERYTIHTDV
jgi:hypothetical protein